MAQRRAGTRALAALGLAVLAVLGTSTPSSAAAKDGSWWYDALNIAANHRIADGTGVTIALLDGPVDNTIPELRGQKVVAGSSVCQQGVLSDGARKSPFGRGLDSSFHATSMAALLVGNGKGTRPDGTGVRGVAPGATLQVHAIAEPTRFSCNGPTRPDGSYDALHVMWPRGLRAAVDSGADVVAMPFASTGSESEIKYALSRGVVLVAAAGNGENKLTGEREDRVSAPGSYRGVIAVNSYDRKGRRYARDAGGSGLVACAPGVDVGTGSRDAKGRWSSNGTNNGSSIATAITAGMIAVVKSKYPNATGAQLVQHVVRHTSREPLSWDGTYGYGPVSLTTMLEADPTRNPDVNPLTDIMYKKTDLRPWTTPVAEPAPSGGETSAAVPESDEAGGSGLPVLPAVGGLAGIAALAAVGLFVHRRGRAGQGAPVGQGWTGPSAAPSREASRADASGTIVNGGR